MDAIDYDLLVFQTDMYLPDAFDSDHSLKFFEIKPSKQQIWDFTLLSCFLNSFPSFFKNKRSPFQVDFSNQSYNARFLFKDSDSSFEIRIGNSIKVIGNLSFLKTFFTRQSQNLFSCLRKWYKFRSHPVFQEHIYYNYSITGISNETECLLFHKPLLFCLKDNFTPIFRFFAKNIQKVGLPETHDTFSIQEYISLFSKRKENCINTLDLLKENLKGLLYLTIQKSQIRHHLAKVEFNGEQYYIIKGLYILPFSQSILTKNENSIDGIITDTTWRILPNYVTSIMMASSKNTGIPISFSFGHSEDKEIYELHFDGFERFTTVKLNSFVFESDQGTALKAVFKDKKIKYFICLRHLLVNLKFNQISFAIRNILFCTSIDELDRAFEFYSKMFSEIKEPQMQKKRDGLLEKVGLMFHDNQIMICNQERWEQVSLNERQKFKMPSTTNALESCHGHLNEKMKRRKNFFQSIFKIAQHLIQKCTSIEKSIQHNYQFAIKKTIDHLRKILLVRIDQEIVSYNTTKSSCMCSENKLLSSIMGIDIPCCHRYYLGCQFPPCPDAILNKEMQWNELIIEFNVLEDDPTIPQNSIQYADKKYATEMIHRYSKVKKRETINKYVEDNYVIAEDEDFILSKPCSVLSLINDGIEHFNEQKQKSNKNED